MRLGVGDALVEQPAVQLLVAPHPDARGEEALAGHANLVLNLPLLPAGRRCARHRVDEVMAAHLQEAPIVGAVLAHQDRVNRGLHVVVDAARAGAPEEGERPIIRVEHHLLRLARIRAHEQHPAVAQPHVCHLHCHRHAVDQNDLMAPVELIGFARSKTQRHIRVRYCRLAFPMPAAGIPPHCIVAAFIANAAQVFEDADQCQPFAHRLRGVRGKQPLEISLPTSQPGQRLHLARIAERGGTRA